MKRLVIRWVALAVFLVLLAYTFVQLGEWQLRRLDERRATNQTILANRDAVPVDYRQLMGSSPVPDGDRWRPVSLVGTYSGEQYQVRYRNQADRPGIEVVATFTTEHGDEVLVNRGFIPRQTGQPDTEDLPATPAGPVEIVGHLLQDERGNANAATPHEFKVRLIDSARIGQSLGRELLPGYVVLSPDDVVAEGSGMDPVQPPEPTEGNHFSYALQWFAFSAIAVVGIAVLIRADLADRRKAQRRSARSQHAEPVRSGAAR